MRPSEQAEGDVVSCVLRFMLIVLIVIGGGAAKHTPLLSDQEKLDRILARMRNQVCESKVIEKRTETRSQ